MTLIPIVLRKQPSLAPGSPKAGIAALNKITGDVIWKKEIPGIERTGHAAIVSATLAQVRQYLIYSDLGLWGVRATDGQILWHYDRLRIPFGLGHTPIVRGELIYCAGFQSGVAAVKVVSKNSGFVVEELYHQQVLELDPFHDTLTLVDDHVYGFKRGGLMLCYSAETGEVRWGPRRRESLTSPATATADTRGWRSSQAALTYADGNLYLRYSDGTMSLAEANPSRYVEKGRFDIPGHEGALGATFPVIAGGRMYLRDDNRLFCYDVRANGRPQLAPRIVDLEIPVTVKRDTTRARGRPRSAQS